MATDTESTENRRILCVGLVCFDAVFHVTDYPAEDDDVRATLYKPARGGNAGTNTVILKQLAPNTVIEFLGNLISGENFY